MDLEKKIIQVCPFSSCRKIKNPDKFDNACKTGARRCPYEGYIPVDVAEQLLREAKIEAYKECVAALHVEETPFVFDGSLEEGYVGDVTVNAAPSPADILRQKYLA